MTDQTTPKARAGHASMPRFIVWVQDHLLLSLLMIASGYINGLMLTEGWVPNIEDPRSWGIFHGIGLAILFAAGGAMGGLTVRVGYKLSECVQNRQGGRAVFLAFGLAALSLIEFWASFSQRAPNLHPTAADSLLPWPPFAFSATAILIAAVLPFTSMFWGFTAEDPAPKPVEDAATVEARMRNKLIEAEMNARIRAAQAKGLRGALGGVIGREEAPPEVVEAPALAETMADEDDMGAAPVPTQGMPPAINTSFKGQWWDAASYRQFLIFQYGIAISLDKAKEVIKRVGNGTRVSLAERKGPPVLVASIGKLKAYAKKEYPQAGDASLVGDVAGVMPE